MRDKDFKKIFKEEFQKDSQCKVTLEDVLSTQGIKTYNDKLYIKYRKQQRLTKYFALNSLVTVLLLVVVIIGFTIKINDYQSKLKEQHVLSNEAIEYISEYCGEDDLRFVCTEIIGDRYAFSIYKGRNKKTQDNHDEIYFYQINENFNLFSIKFNDEEVLIEQEYGILGKVENIEKKQIVVDIKVNDHERKIVINE